MDLERNIHWLDYLIFTLVLLTSCAIGIYHALKKRQNEADYLMGNRQMTWWPVALSIMVSLFSGVSQIGKPAEVYLYGGQALLGSIGIFMSVLFITFTFVPLLYRLKLTSSYEYLELRFDSKAVRLLSSVSVIITQVFYSGVATYTPAVALRGASGLPVWTSILCVGVVSTFYTMIGGLKAVVWSDAFQFAIMAGTLLLILIFGLVEAGGFTDVLAVCKNAGRLDIFNFDPNPLVRLTFWSVVVGNFFVWMPAYSVSQTTVQRFCAVPSLKQAKLVLLLAGIALCVMEVLTQFSGLLVYNYFSGCDPLRHPDIDQKIHSSNELLPIFLMKVIHWPGLPGLCLAAIFSGSLSTVSSCLNALTTVTWEDFLKWKLDHLSDNAKTTILKVMVVLYGVLGTGFAFLTTIFKGPIIQVGVSFRDASSSPLLGMFFLGAFFRRANWLGVIAGGCIGFVLPMWMSLGSFLAVPRAPPLNTSIAECIWNGTVSLVSDTSDSADQPIEGLHQLYRVSYLWLPAIGMLTTVIVGIIVSLASAPFISSAKPADIKEKFIVYSLDYRSRKRNRAEKEDALNSAELNDIYT